MSESLIDQLVESFRKFPGIGPRQARRFVYYLLRANNHTVENLTNQMRELKKSVIQCPSCLRFYPKSNTTKSKLCSICFDAGRDHSLLLIVEKDMDLENVERTDTYNGYYFVLGDLIPILDKEPEQRIRGKNLLSTIEEHRTKGLQEIILALSANPEGDYTAQFVKKLISPICANFNIKVSILGRGLSTGTELEYSDADTLKNALKHRE